jgi:hypothetical protein
MQKYKLILFIPFLFLLSCASPQPSARLSLAQAKVNAEDLARKEFSYGTFAAVMDQAADTSLLTMRPALEKELDRELTHSENDKLKDMIHELLNEVYPEDLWIEEFSKIYTRYFTAEEIDSILKFYDTGPGRKMLELSSTLMSEGERAGLRLFESKKDIFSKRFIEEFTKVFASSFKSETQEVDSKTLNIAETIQACKKIEQSQELPISCQFDYMDGIPSMVVSFHDLETAQYYWKDLSEYVAIPYCTAANSSNRQAAIFINLNNSKLARMFSCETSTWTEWFSYDKKSKF